MSLHVRRLAAHEWRALREIRLRALADAPTAFGTTHAEATAYSDAEWAQRAARGADGGESVTYIAITDNGEWVGMAGGILYPEEPRAADLVGMWVDPAQRGQGAGDALIAAVCGWARAAGALRLYLWVTDGNLPAQRLYERNSFAFAGRSAPLRSYPTLTESLMQRDLVPASR